VLPDLLFASESSKPPLHIAVIVDDGALPQFLAESIGYVTRSSLARIELIVSRAVPKVAPDPLVYRVYAAWDRRHVPHDDDPLARVDAGTIGDVPILEALEPESDLADRLPRGVVERLQNARLDVIVHAGTRSLGGDVLDAARHGVWSFQLGGHDGSGLEPIYFWEVRDRLPVSSLALRRLAGRSQPASTLAKLVVTTEAGLSRARNTLRPCWGATTLLIQKLRELHDREHVTVAGPTAAAEIPLPGQRRGRPTGADLVGWLAPEVGRRAARRLRRIGRSPVTFWKLAVRVGGRKIAASDSAMDGFRWVASPPGRFFADPFLMRDDDGRSLWLFFEDYDYAVRRGRLSCARVEPDGALGEIHQVLDKPYHLSYPYVFRHDGALFMIPESRGAGQIQLYRCTHFPDRWEFERTLLPYAGIDTSIWIEHGTCWLFTTLTPSRVTAPQAWLFSADSLTGPWRVHPASPISTDVRNARSAGALFRHGGKLLRPTQDCGPAYGYSFTLNEIVELSSTRLVERPLVTVTPDWSPGLVATHSYALAGDVEFVDGCSVVEARDVGAR
jgi:hypothetical protein